MNSNYWKIGFHTGPGGNRDGIGDQWDDLTLNGIPAVLVSVDDYGPCYDLARKAANFHVPHIIAFRLSTLGQGNDYSFDVPPYGADIPSSAADYWQQTLAKLPPEFDKGRVWVIVCNEVDKQHSDWLGRFGVAVAGHAEQSGHKILFPAWSSGEPERSDWETAGMIDYLQLCHENPDLVGISIHEYSYTIADLMDQYPYKVGRFQMLLTICGYHGWHPSILITEFGWEERNVPEIGPAVQDLIDANELYNHYPEVMGAAIWYLGPGYGGIADKAQRLIEPTTNLALEYGIERMSTELENGGFEDEYVGDHSTLKCSYEQFPHIIQVGNIMSPPGWLPWFYHSAEFAQPEIRDARDTDPDRMHDGLKGQLLFTFYRKHAGGFLQRVASYQGETRTLTGWAHAWSNHQDGPHPDDPKWSEGAGYDAFFGYTDEITDDDLSNFQFKLGIDPQGGINPYAPSVVWGRGSTIYNVFHEVDPTTVAAQSETITVFLKSDTRWAFKHNDAYWDTIKLSEETPVPETLEEFIWRRTVEEQIAHGVRLNADAAIQQAIEADGMRIVINEMQLIYEGDNLLYVAQAAETYDGSLPRRVYVWNPRTGEVSYFTDPK
jgi:hypothetical protein